MFIHRLFWLYFLLSTIDAVAQRAYIAVPIPGADSDNLVVVDTTTRGVFQTITGLHGPVGVAVTPDGKKVYVTNSSSNTLAEVDPVTSKITVTIPVGAMPVGVAVTPDGTRVYVANTNANSVSVIDTNANAVIATLDVGVAPFGVATTPDGSKIYVTNLAQASSSVSVISTVTNQVTATIRVGTSPRGLAVTPDGSRVYVANSGSNTVSVLSTATDAVLATVPVGLVPDTVAIVPNGAKVYVTTQLSGTVSVISTATNTVSSTITLDSRPRGIAATSDGKQVVVETYGGLILISPQTDTTVANIQVGGALSSFGAFTGPELPTPGFPVIASPGPVDPWTYTRGISPGAWVAIFGIYFAKGDPVTWTPQPGQPIATTLGGVTVSIDGIPAVISYASSTLVNVLVPGGVRVGSVPVSISNGTNSETVLLDSTPFLPAIYSNPGPATSPLRLYVTAVDPFTGELLGTASADPRVVRAVHPGDTIDLFALGLGPTTPKFPTDVDFSDAFSLASDLTVMLGGSSLPPAFAALVSPGLYQVRLVVPNTIQPGDQPIRLSVVGAQSASNVYLTIQQ
jgi:uncharacterized protein (TIGR03437 family)